MKKAKIALIAGLMATSFVSAASASVNLNFSNPFMIRFTTPQGTVDKTVYANVALQAGTDTPAVFLGLLGSTVDLTKEVSERFYRLAVSPVQGDQPFSGALTLSVTPKIGNYQFQELRFPLHFTNGVLDTSTGDQNYPFTDKDGNTVAICQIGTFADATPTVRVNCADFN